MKKKLIVIISITLVAVLGVGVTVGAIAGSNRSAVLIEEEAFVDQYVVDENAEKTKTQIFYRSSKEKNNEEPQKDEEIAPIEKDLSYEKTWNLSEDKTLDIYKDPENEDVEYRYTESKLTGYRDDAAIQNMGETSDDDVFITKDEAIVIAKKHFLEIYGVDVAEAEMVASGDVKGNYLVRYSEYLGVDGFISGPSISVKLSTNGSVLFSSSSLGEFDEIGDIIEKVNQIKKEDTDAFGLKKAQGTRMEYYDYYGYRPDIVTLEKDEEGKYFLNVFGVIEMQEKTESKLILLLPVTYRYDFEY